MRFCRLFDDRRFSHDAHWSDVKWITYFMFDKSRDNRQNVTCPRS